MRPPGPGGHWLRQVPPALKDPLAYLDGLRDRYGDFVEIRRDTTYLLCTPEAVKQVLVDRHPNYMKGPRYREAMQPLLGNGLFAVDGDEWKEQRRIAQPAFSKSLFGKFAELIGSEMDRAVARWFVNARSGEPIALVPEILRMSLDISLRLVFGAEERQRPDNLASSFLAAQREISLVRVFNPLRLPLWAPTPSSLRLRAARAVLDAFIFRTIDERLASGQRGADLLSLYLQANEAETGKPFHKALLRDEMITLLSASHEAVTDAMAWTLLLLMRHTESQERVRNGEAGYLNLVMNESMRLYPPAWGMMRTSIGADELCGYRIGVGCRVLVSPWVIHRSPKVWDRPLEFEPDRFLPHHMEGKHKFAFFPFGAGPRQCIGMGLGMLEMQIALERMLREFDLELVAGGDARPMPRLTLKPDRPVLVRLRARTS